MPELKAFDLDNLPAFYNAREDESTLKNAGVRLDGPRSTSTVEHRREFRRIRQLRSVVGNLQRLPEPHESHHLLTDGSYSLYDHIPGVLEISGRKIVRLTVVTMSMSAENVANLQALVESGTIRELEIITSNFCAASDAPIFQQAAELCRKHNFPIRAVRNHAKLLLFLLDDGRHIVIESSENLRSLYNTGTSTVFNDEGLYCFHRSWVHEWFSKGKIE